MSERHAGCRAGQEPRLQIDPAGDPLEAVRAVPGRVETAITASSTCAVQILLVAFSRRMCCSRVCNASRRGRGAGGILAHADEAARHLPLQRVLGGEEGGVRATETHRHAEALGRADHDVPRPSRRVGSAGPATIGRHIRSLGHQRRGRRRSRRAGRARRRSCRDIAARRRTARRPRSRRYRRVRTSRNSMPTGAARVARTARVWGCRSVARHTMRDFDLPTLAAIVTASAAAVASSSRLALAIGRPVRSAIMVW